MPDDSFALGSNSSKTWCQMSLVRSAPSHQPDN